MPSRITVIHLSEAEAHTLSAAASAGHAKEIANEIAAQIKTGDAVIRAMANARDITPGVVDAAAAAVTAKEQMLAQLPAGEKRDGLQAEVRRAKAIIDECRAMLHHG